MAYCSVVVSQESNKRGKRLSAVNFIFVSLMAWGAVDF